MRKMVPVVLVAIAILLFGRGWAVPGKWEYQMINQYDTYEFTKSGWFPKDRRSLIFGLQACEEVFLTFYGYGGINNVVVYFGYASNAYTLVIPSSDCDATGACALNHYSVGAYLDCSTFKFFWVSWDDQGAFSLGIETTIGANTIISLPGNGLFEEALYMDLTSTDASGVQMYMYIDDEPGFTSPAPDGTTEITIPETAITGNPLYTVAGTDPEGDTVTPFLYEMLDIFSFTGNDLTNLVGLDYETTPVFVITLSVHDQLNVVNTSLTIRLQDVHDETPSVDAVSVSLPEEIGVGSYIDGGFTVSDLDAGDQLTYALSGAHASYFEITVDGRLKIAARIDFDPPNNLHLLDDVTLTVTDLGSNTNSTPLTFTVTDINDNSPVWNSNMYYVDVTENEVSGVLLSSFVVTDDDDADNGQTEISIIDGDDASPKFAISGTDLVTTSDPIDYEDLATSSFKYRLTLQAVDKPSDVVQPVRTSFATVIVTVLPVNEHTPTMTPAPTGLSRSETAAPGDIIHTIVASDGDLGIDGDLTYLLVSVLDDSGTNRDDVIYVDAGKGNVVISSSMDYDTTTGGYGYLDITVQVEDLGMTSLSLQDTFRLEILPENDNPPVFSDVLYQTVVVEGTPIGTTVLAAAATDADGDTLTYSIVDEATFGYTSAITLLKELDFEDKRCYTFLLRANDGSHDVDVPVNVNVSNIIDEFPVITVHNPLTLIEELPVGTPLGGLYDVTDIDVDDILTFSLEGTESSYFKIDAATGLITVDQRMDRDAGLVALSQVTLKVTDSNGNSDSETLAIDIIDINDNSPVFDDDLLFLTVSENAVQDTILSAINAQDDDDGDKSNIVISIASGDDSNPNEKFQLAGSDLKTTATVIDYESLESSNFQYTLFIHAVDQPLTEAKKTSVAVVVITVLPENEFTPTWTVVPADMTISETTTPGTSLAQYTATDDDLGEDGQVTYQLVSVLDDAAASQTGKFVFDSQSGDLILSSKLDFDVLTGGTAFYDVTVKAVDSGTSPLSVDTSFRVNIGPENDNPPVFADALYNTVVAEGTPVGTALLTVAATDNDGDSLTYTVEGEGQGVFSYTGSFVNDVELDYEKKMCYSFILKANDGVHETEVSINVNVSNIIDEDPVISVVSPYNLPEELPIGFPLGGLYDVMDIDEDDTLTYSLEGAGSSYFSIDASTGVITVAQRIDREAGLSSISPVSIKVTDAGGNSDTEPLTLNIDDINDNSPLFTDEVIYINLTENTAPDTAFSSLAVQDLDLGGNGDVVLSIASGDDTPPHDKFYITATDLYTSSIPVDYESLPSSKQFSLFVHAVDQPTTEEPRTSGAVVVITVQPENEFVPVFTSPATSGLTLIETALPGTLVETFVASDDDHGEDGQIVYSVKNTPGSTPMFFIDELSGQLRVAEILDFDTATGGVGFHDVTVVATDKGATPKSAEIVFKVTLQNENDIPPVLVNFKSILSVAEDAAIADVIVALTTQDDDGDVVSASIVDGDVSMFAVSGTDIQLQQKLDYETSACHVIVISITDGVHVVNETLSIQVTDVIDETPLLEIYNPVYITEEFPTGTMVDGLYHVTDLDRGDELTFTLTGTDSPYFSINATSGQMKLAQRIDLESLGGDTVLDQLTLTVEDKAGLQASGSLSLQVLDINDAYPQFSHSVYKVNISESSSTEVLIDLVCTDADSGPNGDITMQITDGDDAGASKFQLTGTELSALGADLDYEALESTQYMYILTVAATDSPVSESPKTGVTLVVVSVLPVNEHDPVWSAAMSESGGSLPDLSMLENVTVGSDLITLQATDDDQGTDGVISYHINSVIANTGESLPDLFSVDSTTGALRVARSLDRDITTGQMYYTVDVSARDGGNPAKEVTATMKIILDNVNDNPPVFTSSDYLIDVSESTPIGTAVHTFNAATDIDGDVITYTVHGGSGSVFGIVGTQIQTLVELDFETTRCYSLIIGASDGIYDVNISMALTITDVIDEPPVVISHNPLVIPEELPVGTRIHWAANVTDADENDVLTYSLTGADAAFFQLDSVTGELTIAQQMDKEAQASIADISIHVEDSASLSTDITLSIDLQDLNDNGPVFDSDVLVVFVEEGGVEVDLHTYVVTDPDSGVNGDYDVTISSGNGGGEFRLDGLTLKGDTSAMDYDVPSVSNHTYVLSITAVDKPTIDKPRTGETTVVVHVGPVNDHSPQWVLPTSTGTGLPDVTLSEDSGPISTSLVTFEATDNDAGLHGELTYSIVSVTSAEGNAVTGLFVIDPVDGALWITQNPDADVISGGSSSYDIIVKAEDGGADSIQATQRIVITDSNEEAPSVSSPTYHTEIAESAAVGAQLFSLTVTDGDGDTVSSTVVEGDAYFSFDGSSVTTSAVLDYENQTCHHIVISVTDGLHVVNVSLSVNVTDVNDNDPVVIVDSSVTLPEELPIGTVIGGVFSAYDLDEDDVLSYSLSGTDATYVDIDATSGRITVKSRMDHEAGVTSLDDLTLSVTDSAGSKVDTALNIAVLDVNDNTPTCTQAVFLINVTENVHGKLTDLSCSDADSGDNGLISVTVTSDSLGYITVTGLEVHVTSPGIDFEAVDPSSPYIVYLEVGDQPTTEAAKTAEVSLIIQVQPENEFSPVWSTPTVDASNNFPAQSLSETSAPGSVIVSVTATDDDEGVDGHITYAIASALDQNNIDRSNLFLIDQLDGTLRTSGEIDRDQPISIEAVTLTITATDGGDVANTATGTLVVDVTAENDNPPVFDQMPVEVDIAEDSASGTLLLNLVASDPDGETVTFQHFGKEDNLFQIVGSALNVYQNLDFESKRCHALTISATDGVYTVNQSLTINVLDSNDESPVVTVTRPMEVPEELAVGTGVARGYTVTDKDEVDQLLFALEGTDSVLLVINSSTGDITVTSRIDYESLVTPNNLDIALKVTDAAGHSVTHPLNLTVTDVNDNSPVFSTAVNFVNVTENAAGETLLLTLACTDADSGNNGLISFNTSNDNSGGLFRLDGSDLYVDVVDYESAAAVNFMYSVTVTAVDKADEPKSAASVVVVEIFPANEHNPSFTSPVVNASGFFPDITVAEDTAIGSELLTFEAEDQDLGQDGLVMYNVTMVTSDSGTETPGLFTIGSSSGLLRVSGILDADNNNYYVISITATDSGSPALSAQGSLRVQVTGTNDNQPVWNISITEVEVFENASIGDEVFLLDASDIDADPLTFSTSDNNFEIDGQKVKVKSQLDYETQRCHTILVSVSDGSFTVNLSFTIKVLDSNDESPEVNVTKAMAVPEELSIGTGVARGYIVTDKDEVEKLSYILEGTDSGLLAINSSTGDITVASRIDYETLATPNSLDISLKVTDAAGHSVTHLLDLAITDVNDNSPVFSTAVNFVNVTENAAGETLLLTLACTDADSGNNGLISFNISGDNSGGLFRLDGGDLYVDVVDYESAAAVNFMYSVTVTAVDKADEPKSAASVVVVEIGPVNEHNPSFSNPVVDASGFLPDITVAEDTAIGSDLMTVEAADQDLGPDGLIMYNVTMVTSDSGTETPGLFTIGSSSGLLRVSGILDADDNSFYVVSITATDSGSPALSVQGYLRVQVTGTNDNQPVWNISITEVEVFENASIGDEVFLLNASDIDADPLTFSTSDNNFEIDGQKVKVKSQLDFETLRCHTILVSVSDGRFISNQSFTINVLDSNDEIPVVTVTKAMSVPEELSIGTGVARGYIVTDKDEVEELSYMLEGTDSGLLAINSSYGDITVDARIDYESLVTPNSLDISLKVTDAAGHSVTHLLDLAVTDVNDNSPVFSTAVNFVDVTENAAGETLLLTLACTDADSGNNGLISINISSDNSGGLFRLDGSDLYVGVVDYESAAAVNFMYSVTVTAVDKADEPKSAASVVVVEIIPTNEFDPQWQAPVIDGSGRFPDISLSEDVLPGHPVVTVDASDDDMGVDGDVTYNIVSVVSDSGANEDTKFAISSITGVLTTSTQLDFDTSTGGTAYYDVTVRASDGGSTPRTATAVQRINLQNFNDIAPVFTQSVYRTEVTCNTPAATLLVSLSADDEDSSSLEYSLLAGTNPYILVDIGGDVSLLSYPLSSAVVDLAQSVAVEATDKGTPELKGMSRVLILFENCANSSVTCDNTTTTTPATTVEPVTCEPCAANSTSEPCTTNSTCAPCPTSSTCEPCPITVEPVTAPANCTESIACNCTQAVTEVPAEDAMEAWAMRGLVMLLSVALLGAAIMFFRPKTPNLPRKVLPRQNSMERGISDDSQLKFDELEHHYLHK